MDAAKRSPARRSIFALRFSLRLLLAALTAFAMRGDQEKILAAGCNGYLAKPFHYPDFLAKVAQALHQEPDAGPTSGNMH